MAREENPTLYEALIEALHKKGLEWHDLEDVFITQDGKVHNLGDFGDGDIEGYAHEVLRGIRIQTGNHSITPESRNNNRPFYAYTRDYVFFMRAVDESGAYRIESIPLQGYLTRVEGNEPRWI